MPTVKSEEALRERVEHLFRNNHIERVIVVDDGLVPTFRHETWTALIAEVGASDAAMLGQLEAVAEESGTLPLASEQPPELLKTLFQLAKKSTSEAARKLASTLTFAETELDRIVAWLKTLCKDVKLHTTVEDVPADAHLYFIDYTIDEPADQAGGKASRLLQRLVEHVKANGSPPAVVLMSRNKPDRSQWERVARDGGFLRFCFRYIEKPDISLSQDHFMFYLDELLESVPIGKAFFAQILEFSSAMADASAKVTKHLFGLSPADFRHFAARRLKDKDGRQAARHLRYLFVRLLESELEASAEVEEAMQTLGETLTQTELRIRGDIDENMLYQLQSRILYDRSTSALQSPVTFGDVFRETTQDGYRFYLCITPECDLEIRATGKAKAESLLLLEGVAVDAPFDQAYLEHTPLVPSEEKGQTRWFEWNFRRPRVIPYPNAAAGDGGLERWGRLRHEFAEKVQQRFASDLLEVGTEETISGTRVVQIALLGGTEGKKDCGKVSVIRSEMGNEQFWAITEDCLDLFRDARRPFISADAVRELQFFRPTAEFCEISKRHKLILIRKDDAFAFVWSPGGTLDKWAPPDSWAGYSRVGEVARPCADCPILTQPMINNVSRE